MFSKRFMYNIKQLANVRKALQMKINNVSKNITLIGDRGQIQYVFRLLTYEFANFN